MAVGEGDGWRREREEAEEGRKELGRGLEVGPIGGRLGEPGALRVMVGRGRAAVGVWVWACLAAAQGAEARVSVWSEHVDVRVYGDTEATFGPPLPLSPLACVTGPLRAPPGVSGIGVGCKAWGGGVEGEDDEDHGVWRTEAGAGGASTSEGFIAIVSRGECPFVTKVRRAQEAGARGVIVCDNVREDTLTMESSEDASDVAVPSVFLSYDDCVEVGRAMKEEVKRPGGGVLTASLCGGMGFELRPMSTEEAAMAAMLGTLFICAVSRRLANQRRSLQERMAPYAAARRTTHRRRLAISECLNLPTRIYTKGAPPAWGDGATWREGSDVAGEGEAKEDEGEVEVEKAPEEADVRCDEEEGAVAGAALEEGCMPSCSKAVAAVPAPSESDPDGIPCVICLDNFEEGDVLRVLPCRHEFHQPCVDRWFKEGRQFCPMCKWDFVASLDEDASV